MYEQIDIFGDAHPDTWSGKTYQAHSVPTREKTFAPCSKKPRGSSSRTVLFLDLRRGNGRTPDASWATDGPLHGAYTMRSFGESPSVAAESRLSQILEENPHPKYYLSAKACEGILRRAERRGKELPPMLRAALERQSVSKETASTEPTPPDATARDGATTM